MAESPTPSEAGSAAGAVDPTLDRFLIALQKTLSRVSRDSAHVPADQARALIVGNVTFDVDLRCDLRDDGKLALESEGAVGLRLSGKIATDLGIAPEEPTGERTPAP